jgi:hypothetical protein
VSQQGTEWNISPEKEEVARRWGGNSWFVPLNNIIRTITRRSMKWVG